MIKPNIDEYRCKIDDLDQEIMSLLSQRFDYSQKIGQMKKRESMKILNNSREEQIINKTKNFENSKAIRNIYDKILEQSKELQR